MKKHSLHDLFEVTYKHRWANRAREGVEIRNIRFWVSKLPPIVGRISLQHLDDVIFEELRKGNKPATINSKLQTLKTCLDFTRERGLHSNDLKIKRVKQPSNARLGFFSEEDEQRVLDSLGKIDPRFQAFFVWSIETGLRPSESRPLTVKDIRKDPQLGYVIDVRKTKNGEPRTVPLTDRAWKALNDSLGWDDMNSYKISRTWAKLRRADAFFDKFVFYHTRHTCATRLLSKGVNVKVVQEWMGHKDIHMTLRYAKAVPQDLAAARDLLEK